MAFSHQIVHDIGGPADTHRNTTQRILLLLESQPIGDAAAHDRVLSAVLQRYLQGDRIFVIGAGENTVPRFLLNDIVRFWRTMGVDFAAKQLERRGAGWGLRNAKLRMSRKLIFTAGLIVCFDCHLNRPANLADANMPFAERLSLWQTFLKERMTKTPLEILARFVIERSSATAGQLFDSYNEFLSLLADQESRIHLESLRIEQAGQDALFQRMRQIGHAFQDGLSREFFDESEAVRSLVRKYGIF